MKRESQENGAFFKNIFLLPVHYSFPTADTDGWASVRRHGDPPRFPGKQTNTGPSGVSLKPWVERALVKNLKNYTGFPFRNVPRATDRVFI